MSYATPEAFKNAIEARIRKVATERRQPIPRVRQLVVFDRFLARVFDVFGERAIVKGGAALELRLDRARTTRDIDLRMSGSPEVTAQCPSRRRSRPTGSGTASAPAKDD